MGLGNLLRFLKPIVYESVRQQCTDCDSMAAAATDGCPDCGGATERVTYEVLLPWDDLG